MVQPSFDELGRPLRDIAFCVVDLETTGGSARDCGITEIGAVKVRGGEVLGEFQTLVNPDAAIPAYIQVLTGITDAMVIEAPRIAEALPSFLEFAHGCVLVAHNAPFDIGFLKAAARRLDMAWPRHEVLDTVVLARRALIREEVRNLKLGTLAAHFGAATTPNHRALSDARATVDVLHGIFERLGSLGVHTFEEAAEFTSTVSANQRRKRYLADTVPDAPGVYLFRDAKGEVLYVGTSKRLRARVRSYFTKAETRSRIGDMINLAERVDSVVCATALEARVREIRLIGAHRPPYNRRSKFPDRQSWLKLTREPWPRVSIVRAVGTDGADYIGPFRGQADARAALTAIHDVFAIRQCTGRLPVVPRGSACALAEMGHCLSPCDGSVSPARYADEVARAREAITADSAEVVDALLGRITALADAERFEDAAMWRDRLAALVRGAARTHRLRELSAQPEIVAAAPHQEGWEMHVIRHGRLAAAGVLPRGTDYRPWLQSLVATAESVAPGADPLGAATIEETETLRQWMLSDGVRIVRGRWAAPLASPERHLARLTPGTSPTWAARDRATT